MEDCDHTCIGAKVLFATCKIAYHTPGRIEENFIHASRLIQAEFIECCRQGEDHMKIGCWKQLRFSGLYPPFALYLLALWAMAIPAGIITDANMTTGGA
jgi:hypothetical protein